MIIIAGDIHIDPERVEEALEAAWPHIEGGRSQPGCLAYDWSSHRHDTGLVHVFERWESHEALAAHLAGPHYKNMLETMGQFGVKAAEVSKFRIDLQGPVYDSHGKARADFF